MTEPAENDEDNFRQTLSLLWRRRWLMLVVTMSLAGAAFLAALVWPKRYQASVLVMPVAGNSGTSSALGSLASRFGGLASLAGVSLGGGDSGRKAESIALVQSALITERYIQQNKLLPILYARQWNATKRSWRSDFFFARPTLWSANRLFKKKIRVVSIDPRTGLVKITISWINPVEAADWANGIVALVNEYSRQKAIKKCQRELLYLENEARTTHLLGLQQSIAALEERILNEQMLAKESTHYALKVIDPAEVPQKPSSPKIGLWTAVGLFAGLVISLIVALYE
ncbi:MAG: Wzz/FepE/Etk N-terminal domain-containing protein [Steroidobacteraceae bacterium]